MTYLSTQILIKLAACLLLTRKINFNFLRFQKRIFSLLKIGSFPINIFNKEAIEQKIERKHKHGCAGAYFTTKIR